MLHTAACDALGIAHPVCQAGMATYTSPELVAAVSNAGGLGVHGSLGRDPDELRALIRATRQLCGERPFGVNLVLSRLEEVAFTVCLEERVPVLCFSWGDPNDTVHRVREARAAGARVICQVATVAEVHAQLTADAEALIAQGTAGGAYSELVPLEAFLAAVVACGGETPVIAAGGLVCGCELPAAFALGAAGCWVGTRFLGTKKATIVLAWKAAIVASRPGDTVHSLSFDTI